MYKKVGVFVGLLGCTIAGSIAGCHHWQCILAVMLAIFSAGLIAYAVIFWKEGK